MQKIRQSLFTYWLISADLPSIWQIFLAKKNLILRIWDFEIFFKKPVGTSGMMMSITAFKTYFMPFISACQFLFCCIDDLITCRTIWRWNLRWFWSTHVDSSKLYPRLSNQTWKDLLSLGLPWPAFKTASCLLLTRSQCWCWSSFLCYGPSF